MDWKKFLSRKFLLALSAFVAVTLATFGVKQGDVVADAILRIGGALVDMFIVLGYLAAEAAVDKARAENGNGPPESR